MNTCSLLCFFQNKRSSSVLLTFQRFSHACATTSSNSRVKPSLLPNILKCNPWSFFEGWCLQAFCKVTTDLKKYTRYLYQKFISISAQQSPIKGKTSVFNEKWFVFSWVAIHLRQQQQHSLIGRRRCLCLDNSKPICMRDDDNDLQFVCQREVL